MGYAVDNAQKECSKLSATPTFSEIIKGTRDSLWNIDMIVSHIEEFLGIQDVASDPRKVESMFEALCDNADFASDILRRLSNIDQYFM